MSFFKRITAFSAALAAFYAFPPEISAGNWVRNSGNGEAYVTYLIDNNDQLYLENGDFTIDGKVYSFDEKGRCIDPPDTELIKKEKKPDNIIWESGKNGEKTCTVNGRKCGKGLHLIDGIMYRFGEGGVLIGRYTGWRSLNGDKSMRQYYSSGEPSCGWTKINEKYYYFCEWKIENGKLILLPECVYSGECADKLVSISDINVTADNKYLSFKISNTTGHCVDFNTKYIVEKLGDGGKWEKYYEAPHNSAAFHYPSGSSYEVKLKLYMKRGKYRIRNQDSTVCGTFTYSKKGVIQV